MRRKIFTLFALFAMAIAVSHSYEISTDDISIEVDRSQQPVFRAEELSDTTILITADTLRSFEVKVFKQDSYEELYHGYTIQGCTHVTEPLPIGSHIIKIECGGISYSGSVEITNIILENE